MHVSTKAQITIPQNIRNEFGLFPNTEVEFVVINDQIVLKKLSGH
jgi:AbrB family looped-hinge helix DNA binding protein